MIRVQKSDHAPESLATTRAYDGEDVKQQLLSDQHDKCYLCERILSTDFQIEHLRSQEHSKEDRQNWNNLFLACGYCNGKKLANFDNIVDPAQTDVELAIKQEIDYSTKKAVFTPLIDSAEIDRTIQLLQRIHNGHPLCRKIKEERFFEGILSSVNDFMQLVKAYLDKPTIISEEAVRLSLSVNKPALGFKYWIIKSNPTLEAVFSKDIVWNKNVPGVIK